MCVYTPFVENEQDEERDSEGDNDMKDFPLRKSDQT